MKKTLQEEKQRILDISRKLNENLYADDYEAKKDLEQLQRDEMGYDEPDEKEDVHITLGRMQAKLERCHQNLERLNEYLKENPEIHEIQGFVRGILHDFD